MHTQHSTLTLNAHRIHIVDFDPATFTPHDMLWLPHHARLQHAGRKRNTEHLAGRIAAVHALREYGQQQVPDIGEGGEPCWPGGLYGSISHSDSTAIAVVAQQRIGIDVEICLSPQLCADIVHHVVDGAERDVLESSGVPFPLALSVAFSAKESLFKAFSSLTHPFPGFHSARVIALGEHSATLQCSQAFSDQLADICIDIAWIVMNHHIITLVSHTPSGS